MIRSYYHLALVALVALVFLCVAKGDGYNLFWQFLGFLLTLVLIPWDLFFVKVGRFLVEFAGEIQDARVHLEGKLFEMKSRRDEVVSVPTRRENTFEERRL
jgi:hypothetical protein